MYFPDKVGDASVTVSEINNLLIGTELSSIPMPNLTAVFDLRIKYNLFLAFCEKIHSRVEAKIDEPFHYGMTKVVDKIYSVNRRKIPIDCSIGEEFSISIIDLLSLIAAIDTALKNTFDESLTRIRNFEPGKDLQQMIVDVIIRYNLGKDVSDIHNKDITLLIKYYEMLYPEKANSFNELFEDVDITYNAQNNIDNIKYFAYSSQEPFHSLFFNNLEYAILGHTEPYTMTLSDGTVTTNKDFGFHSEGIINLDLTSDRRRPTERGFFHEYGHFIDWKNGKASAVLRDSIYTDVYDNLRGEITKKVSDQSDVEIILESFAASGIELTDHYLIGKRKEIILLYYDEDKKTGLLKGSNNVDASDIYGGVSNNKIHGEYYHFKQELINEDPQKAFYWYDVSGSPTGSQNKEFFAGAFSNEMMQNAEANANIAEFFPNTSVEFKELVNSLANE
jgi:hypothetical protein